ncbi:MAG: hypothetical protein ACI97A_000534 [Planctomycetota bacterium]|jgi:hypothetical protein
MKQSTENESPSMVEEIKLIESGLKRREEQLLGLEQKLDAAVDALALDLSAVSLPPNMGAILNQLPEEETMPEPEEQPVEKHPETHIEPLIQPENPELAQLPTPVSGQPTLRDPAVIELLHQSAGMAQRQEHTRVSVENLDKKVDTLARELHQWRGEDDRREAEKKDAGGLFLGMSTNELKRLVGMGVFFLLIVIIWHLIVD